MVIAGLKLTFAISPDTTRHGTAKRIKDHLWSKHKVAVAEIPSDNNAEVVMGVASVGSDENNLTERMQQLLQGLREWGSVDLIDHELEVMHFEDVDLVIDHEKNFQKYDP
mgnify:FL=1